VHSVVTQCTDDLYVTLLVMPVVLVIVYHFAGYNRHWVYHLAGYRDLVGADVGGFYAWRQSLQYATSE